MRNYRSLLCGLGAVLVIAMALSGGAFAGCASCVGGGSGGTWMGPATLGISSYGETSSMDKTAGTAAAGADLPSSVITARALYEGQQGDDRRVLAYVGVPGDESYIEGSIHLPLDQVFNADDSLKSPAQIAAIFGAAGISEDDPLVIYGDYFVNGYDTFAFWVMKYLGHQDVLLLEGTRGGREAAGLNFVNDPAPREARTYTPDPNPDLFAPADQLEGRRLVDPRTPAEYNVGHLEGAINIDYTKVVSSNGLATSQALAQAFSGLDKDQQVFVYSSKGGLASIVWYALYSQNYDAGLSILS